jgi:arylsulfatase A
MLKRLKKILLQTLLLSMSSLALASGKPNIILILADDLGIETLNAYGGESYKTPQLDQLATEGMRFDNAHAQPLCTPSRVKLMTGKYNFRNYQHFMHLNPNEKTFAHALKAAGYKTLIAGKWQLYNNGIDDVAGMLPEQSGFDDYLLWQIKREDLGSRYWGPHLSLNGKASSYDNDVFGPDIINQHVTDFIAKADQQPFFIYYPMVLPHSPFVTTPDSLDAETKSEKFAGMVKYMDKLVGNVHAALIDKGLDQNTVVLFIGDNGTDTTITSTRNGIAIEGGKGKTTDNGTHVPFIAWGPSHIATGVNAELVNLNDFFPTLMELAGAKMPADHPQDGVSLVPWLNKTASQAIRDHQFIHYNPVWGQVPGRFAFNTQWKLYERGEFYNTAEDINEKNNLSNHSLTADALSIQSTLQQTIDTMPGDPVPFWRTVPTPIYWILSALLIVSLGLVAALLLFIKRKMQK